MEKLNKPEKEYAVAHTEDALMVDDLVEIKQLKVNTDDRGNLFEIVRKDSLPDGLEPAQVYFVENHARDTIRGFHMHNVMYDWFHIPKGAALFIFFKTIKAGASKTTLYQRVTVTDKVPCVITVPPGVYHGWVGLTDDTCLISIASQCYDREKPDEVRVPWNSLEDVVPGIWNVQFK